MDWLLYPRRARHAPEEEEEDQRWTAECSWRDRAPGQRETAYQGGRREEGAESSLHIAQSSIEPD